MKLFDLYCPKCDHEKADVLLADGESLPACEACGQPMAKKLGIGCFTFGKGRSVESRQDWAAREHARLQKRSDDFDKSPKGRELREKQLDVLRKRGNPV